MTEKAPFKARMNLADVSPPLRVYIHRAGLNEVFGSEQSAKDYFREQYRSYLGNNFEGYDFVIAVLWGAVETQVNYRHIDVFGYGFDDEWPGNPDVSNFGMKNGMFAPLRKATDVTTCGDTLILLGEEEKYRRTTPDISVYMNIPPSLDGLLASD